MLPVLATRAGDKRGRPGHDIEGRGIGGAALRIDEFVDDDPRVRRKAECRLVVKCDAERGVGGRRKRIVLEDRVIDAQRNGSRRLGAGYGRIALQRGNLTDLIGGGLIRWRRILRTRRTHPGQQPSRCAGDKYHEFAPLHFSTPS